MADVLLWLLAVEGVGLIAFPLAYVLFPFLSDRGYALSKPLGILLLTYLVWLLGSLQILPATQWTIAGVLLLLVVGSGALLWWRRYEVLAFLRKERASLLAIEIVFLLLFLVWVGYRAYDPSIDHTEQPMDFAFLNASLLAHYFPPEDPWLLGNPVSYYYLGYLMMGTITEITGVVPSVAYNLALALLPALAGAAAFSLVVTLVRSAGPSQPKPPVKAWAFGAFAVVLLLLVSNLLGVLEGLRLTGFGSSGFWEELQVKDLEGPSTTASWYPQEHWWWWRSSRIVDTLQDGQSLDYTINEFPFFSFLLGDLHPHVMSLPFILLVLGFCLNLLRDPAVATSPYSRRRLPFLGFFALALGALGFLNLWDLPTLAFVVGGAVFLRFLIANPSAPLLKTLLRILPIVGFLLPLAWLLYLPFYGSFDSQASGVLPVTGPVTRYTHILIIWALFLVPLAVMVGGHLLSLFREDRYLSFNALVALGVVVAPFLLWALALLLVGEPIETIAQRYLHLLPFFIFLWAALYGLLEGARQGASLSLLAALGLTFVGIFLLMGPELFYLVDLFNNRMNTVFKLYYQAWVLLALASAFALYYWYSRLSRVSLGWRNVHYAGLAFFSLLLVGSLYYPVAASYSKAGGFQGPATLDGLAYVGRESSGEYAAIQELRKIATPDTRILEAVGNDYSSYGRFSASTGLPTLLGWEGHELQWRGSSRPMEGRREAVDRIYGTADPREAEELLIRYDVEYVVVGPREISQYGLESMEKFASFMEPVFDQDGFVVYQRRPVEGG